MSKKNLDKKNRLRDQVIAFRVSKAERYTLDERYLLSGYRLSLIHISEPTRP